MSGNEKLNNDRLNTARELLNQFLRSELKSSEFETILASNESAHSVDEEAQSEVILADSELTKSQKKAKQRLTNKAVYYLSLREFSTQELRQKLRAGAFEDCETRCSGSEDSESKKSQAKNSETTYIINREPDDAFSTNFTEIKQVAAVELNLEWLYLKIDEVVEDFKARSLVSDERFTEQVVNARKAKFGSSRIAQELKKKGVEEILISAAIANVKTDELANAADICRKKYKTQPANRNEWASRARFLQSRGFSFDIIKKVLNQNIQDE